MTAKTWAIAVFSVSTVLYPLGVVLVLLAGEPLSLNEATYPTAYAFAVVGFLIALNRPGNRFAWICLCIGFVWALYAAATGAATYGLAHPGTVPWPEALAALGVYLWVPGVFGIATFVLMYFPDGRLPSRRWRWLPWIAGLGIAGGYVMIVLSWTPIFGYGLERLRIDNPFARIPEEISEQFMLVVFAAAVGSVAALTARYRRSSGIERQQLKWFATAGSATIVVLMVLVGFLVDRLGETWGLIGFSFAIVIPISIGIAILRYRLYDIDRLISRTVAYALVVGLLAGVFASVVIGLPRVIGVPEENQVLVAGATLAVAALFNPLRRRVQSWVDRRFNRARYDAQQEVERLSERIRDEVELDDLADEMLGVVEKTLQPSGAAVWIRENR